MLKEILPKAQGLYSPENEHDACGIGFIANKKGIRSNDIIKQSLKMLNNLKHRGGISPNSNIGDGAGILIQIPHKLFEYELAKKQMVLPSEGKYGVGMCFLPQDNFDRVQVEKLVEKLISEEEQEVIGWRDVSTNLNIICDEAISTMPKIKQIFIKKNKLLTEEDFERKLFVIRKRIEKEVKEKYIYICSLSAKTIVYKGLLTGEQLGNFYLDLQFDQAETSIAMVHSRYSTNTFPSWEKAHPHRYIVHNGEINTIRGNVNWMNSRQSSLKSTKLGDDFSKVLPVISEDGSDSAMFDNSVEFLKQNGRSLPLAMMMMIPEPWSKNESMPQQKKDFYEYHSCLMEPWDGPASIAFTDGTLVGAVLDRNGLRPSRYYVTEELVIMSSEVGAVEIPEKDIITKQRLSPGRMLLVDTKEGRIIEDAEIKKSYFTEYPYHKWLKENIIHIEDIRNPNLHEMLDRESINLEQKIFGYNFEEIRDIIEYSALNGTEPIGSMGIDMPLAVLSDIPQSLFSYFKQLFAQVTNPPIDAIRENIITSSQLMLTSKVDLFEDTCENCKQIKLNECILDNEELLKLKSVEDDNFKSVEISTLFQIDRIGNPMEEAINNIFNKVEEEIKNGANIIILSDKGVNTKLAPIPILLVSAGVHHYLIKNGMRQGVNIIAESGEAREVHHFAMLLGYGVVATNPYLALDTIKDIIDNKQGETIDYRKAVKNYIKANVKGITKILSKMGISTFQSYYGAQIFEAIGIDNEVIDKYFSKTKSRIGGIDINDILEDVKQIHKEAIMSQKIGDFELKSKGELRWRKDGEEHIFNPETIYLLQNACRTNDYQKFKEFSETIKNSKTNKCTLRGMMDFKSTNNSVSIDEVESISEIVKRFKTGAMSYGSISQEAHETIAIAMNRIGGKSNTGEGGEDPRRNVLAPNGDSKKSAIKQVASGRFGVNINYLTNAKEIQIKIAQGAKPGEGGQLPGKKVYPWIAEVRNSTPGVGLISPPPHHDIYSIEDLAQLIYDLKNANEEASISVKLVSEVGVGTIAAGVAKGKADIILISGYDGGTGAAPLTSIRHTGLPWELGLAETQQTLVLNNLRGRVKIETDGKFVSGRDVVIATLLGAEEFGFATAPLIVLGCAMMRVCHQDTCPMGIATQNPELRKNFKGKPEYVENFMYFIAQEIREIMAELGFRKMEDMVGRVDLLTMGENIDNKKAKKLDFSAILFSPHNNTPRRFREKQDSEIEKTIDYKYLIGACKLALEFEKKVEIFLKVKNTNRAFGTYLGSKVTQKYGEKGLSEDTIKINLNGSAGQSFGAFIPKGVTLSLEGDCNDYVGKGISGGKIFVYPPEKNNYIPEENIIIGNVAFYGGTKGETYISGMAGERFCVRNSGVTAVVEGVGDHGCEYMTGGTVLVIGKTGRNFAAGMSGGIAYVLDEESTFNSNCNKEMVSLKGLSKEDLETVKELLQRHYKATNSVKAKKVLNYFEAYQNNFVKVMPVEYEKTLEKSKVNLNINIVTETINDNTNILEEVQLNEIVVDNEKQMA
jgi:glutamate synthase (NADPH/NADH) large chain